MESLFFAFNAVAPLIITALIGYIIKRLGLVTKDIAKPLNKIVFRVFLPCLLFLNIYKIESFDVIDAKYIIFSVLAVFAVFLLSIPFSVFASKQKSRRSVIIQGVFRSNYALIGIPLAEALFGAKGIAVATVLSAIAIPLFNVLAIVTLSVFGGEKKVNIKAVLLGIAKNPLIIGVFSGLAVLGVRALFVNSGISFRLSEITPAFTVLDYLSRCATPLALLTLGIQFEFSAVKELKREIILATLARLVFVPVLTLSVAYFFFDFGGEHFAAFVALFATPVAVSSVPMAQEMNADARLAGQLVVWNTLFSGLTIFIYAFILKSIGVF
jgi:predicted permease